MIQRIDEYPIPFDLDEIIQMQEDALDEPFSRIHDEEEIERSVDGFHERYIDEMVRTDEWSVFRCDWYVGKRIYFWNHQLGYGLSVDGSWETMCAFVEMMEAFTDEYSSEDFEPAHYAWELP